jgi:hypothetical protein
MLQVDTPLIENGVVCTASGLFPVPGSSAAGLVLFWCFSLPEGQCSLPLLTALCVCFPSPCALQQLSKHHSNATYVFAALCEGLRESTAILYLNVM